MPFQAMTSPCATYCPVQDTRDRDYDGQVAAALLPCTVAPDWGKGFGRGAFREDLCTDWQAAKNCSPLRRPGSYRLLTFANRFFSRSVQHGHFSDWHGFVILLPCDRQ